MTPGWDYFWPVMALGLLLGAVAGTIWFRRNRPWALAIGAAIGLAGAALWHWPLGAADRLANAVERSAQAVLVDWEMSQVEARLPRDPLTRKLLLAGEADAFQRRELARMMGTIPGVSSATWSRTATGMPLILESAIVLAVGFLAGLLVAYVAELRRRHNAQWRW